MDANDDVLHNLNSNTKTIYFNIGGTTVGYFTPGDALYANGGSIFNKTACIGHDPSHNLVIINNCNGGVLLPDIDFSINDTVLTSFSAIYNINKLILNVHAASLTNVQIGRMYQ